MKAEAVRRSSQDGPSQHKIAHSRDARDPNAERGGVDLVARTGAVALRYACNVVVR